MASALGISRTRLASYEYGRAPLRYGFADEFCRLFGVNQRWLAEGKHPLTYYVRIDPSLDEKLNHRALFSDVYARSIKAGLERHLCEVAQRAGIKEEDITGTDWQDISTIANPVGFEVQTLLLSNLQLIISDGVAKLPKKLYAPFYRCVCSGVARFLRDHDSELKKLIYFANEKESDSLRSMPSTEIKSLWKELLRRLEKLTGERGSRSRLANDVGLTRQAVSKWFSGKGEPSAEIALKAAAWADREESKRKRK